MPARPAWPPGTFPGRFPWFTALPESKIHWVLLVSLDGDPSTGYHVIKLPFGKLAVTVKFLHGKVNITELAKQAGLKKSDLYRGKCRDLINEICEFQGITGIEFREDQEGRINDREKMQLARENNNLKRKNASLYAEVQDLRRQVRRLQKIEEINKSGRQVII